MAIKELRYCDVCTTEYVESNFGWMILVVPNAPEEVGQKEFDFCSFDCLHSWVTTDDEESDEVPVDPPGDIEVPAEIAQAAQPVPPADQPAPRPAMTLMDAVAMGAKPGFDPLLQGRSPDGR